jgi:hypothetical protein
MLSRAMLRSVYAPEFLAFLPARFGAVVRARMERGFARHANAENPYARLLLLGESSDPCARVSRAAALRFVAGDAASVLEACAPGSFAGFALSNILDGAKAAYRSRLAAAVRRAATSEAVVVQRSFAEQPSETAVNHAAEDRSLLWGQVSIGRPEQL